MGGDRGDRGARETATTRGRGDDGGNRRGSRRVAGSGSEKAGEGGDLAMMLDTWPHKAPTRLRLVASGSG